MAGRNPGVTSRRCRGDRVALLSRTRSPDRASGKVAKTMQKPRRTRSRRPRPRRAGRRSARSPSFVRPRELFDLERLAEAVLGAEGPHEAGQVVSSAAFWETVAVRPRGNRGRSRPFAVDLRRMLTETACSVCDGNSRQGPGCKTRKVGTIWSGRRSPPSYATSPIRRSASGDGTPALVQWPAAGSEGAQWAAGTSPSKRGCSAAARRNEFLEALGRRAGY